MEPIIAGPGTSGGIIINTLSRAQSSTSAIMSVNRAMVYLAIIGATTLPAAPVSAAVAVKPSEAVLAHNVRPVND